MVKPLQIFYLFHHPQMYYFGLMLFQCNELLMQMMDSHSFLKIIKLPGINSHPRSYPTSVARNHAILFFDAVIMSQGLF